MKPVGIILRRELGSYFSTPLAVVVILFFLVLANAFAFFFGSLYERGQADMVSFFKFLPWLYLLLCPAVSMRLWSEERRSGSIELLLTQPITLWQAVIGKFLAAWLFVGLALALTFPLWISVNYLGNPDNGVIVAAYLGSFFVAGGFLAVGSFTSALTKNQLVAFLVAAGICFLLLLAGYPLTTAWFETWAPQWVMDGIYALSFLGHFESIVKGVFDLRDVLYFALVSIFFLLASATVLESVKSR
jgi:gliding motility-associated transport system permease protein